MTEITQTHLNHITAYSYRTRNNTITRIHDHFRKTQIRTDLVFIVITADEAGTVDLFLRRMVK